MTHRVGSRNRKWCFIIYPTFKENKRPNWPHIVHLSTIGQGGHLVFHIGPKNANLAKDVEILFPLKFHWIPFHGFRDVENVSANQRPCGHLVFRSARKNTNLVEDVKILLPVKIRWIPVSGLKREVENGSANQMPSCFFRSAQKTQSW